MAAINVRQRGGTGGQMCTELVIGVVVERQHLSDETGRPYERVG